MVLATAPTLAGAPRRQRAGRVGPACRPLWSTMQLTRLIGFGRHRNCLGSKDRAHLGPVKSCPVPKIIYH